MQAVSGAGYPGVPSLDILGNIVPFIGGEEEKMETETLKILGSRRRPGAVPGRRQRAHQPRAGHRWTYHDRVGGPRVEAVEMQDVIEAMRTFRGRPQELGLPTAPDPAIVVMSESNRPQPRLDAMLGDGMAISVGRMRTCPVLTHKFVALGHNTIRGAAGASV